MMTARKILHLDLDAFFCAVEELRDPSLAGKPFAVGGSPQGRGVVSSCSYAARMYGVHSAMPMAQAMRACPELEVVRGKHSEYSAMSRQVRAVFDDLTPLVQPISIDEAFLDVSDLPESAETIARELQARIDKELRLPSSVGVASNKLVAKIANNIGKARHKAPTPPRAIMVVPPGQEAAFLAPLPLKELWGVGPKTEEKLKRMGFQTIGDIARVEEKMLSSQFGKHGYDLWKRARGIDDRPVEHSSGGAKSISQETTFPNDIVDGDYLRQTLARLAEHVAYRLRQQGLCAGTVRIKLRWSDFNTPTRQLSLSQPTDADGVITQAAHTLFDALWDGRPVRLLGVGTSNLTPCSHQLSLWETPDEKERRLLIAMDELRERYGEKVVRRGRSLKKGK
jgi:DNA polymerase IV